ncbi:MAG: hypothetical protein MJ003_04965 [Paludibacteraceae bacterium]|nr:hypothetical protein [Paludibacteraceae bacterium]
MKKYLIIALLAFSASAFAGLTNMSLQKMMSEIWTSYDMSKFVAGTTFSKENNDETTEDDNFFLSGQLFKRNIAFSFSGYAESFNGNFNAAGSAARQYAIVNNPKDLRPDFLDIQDDGTKYNRLVFHAPENGKDAVSITFSGYKAGTPITFLGFLEEVSGKTDGSIKFEVMSNGKKVGEIGLSAGSYAQPEITATAEDLGGKSSATFTFRRVSGSGDDLVVAFSTFAIVGTPDVPLSGVSISASDGGKELGNSVSLNAMISEQGVTCDNIVWQRKNPGSDTQWEDMNQKGCDITDMPIYAGKTRYRVQYVDATGASKYSNEVEVKRINVCDGKASNKLFFEDFGILKDVKDHAQCANTPYSFAATCYPVKDGGQYAVVASGKWAGCDDVGRDEKGACKDNAGKYWFRTDLKSHDGNELGGMLLLNCQDGDKTKDVLYNRKVTLDCPNTTVTFTFFIAQASNEASDPINLLVELLNDKNQQVDDPVVIEDQLLPGGNWKEFTMQFNTEGDTSVTIKITNKAPAGAHGNDIFLDDLSFSICVPEVALKLKSGGVLRGKQVKADCGSDVTLNVDATAVAGIADPYYLWVVSENGGEYVCAEEPISGKGQLENVFVPQADKSYSTYVILAPNKELAIKYFNNEKTDCQPVAATDTLAIICSIPSLSYTRICNDIDFSAQVTPGDVVTLQYSVNGVSAWQDIQTIKTTATQSGAKFKYTLVNDGYFRISSVSESGTSTTPAIEIKSRSVTLTASATDGGAYSNLVYINEGASAFFKAEANFEQTGENKKLFAGGAFVSNCDDIPTEVPNITTPNKYSVTYAGCNSEAEVQVLFIGSVEIEEVKREECNKVTYKAHTSASEVTWYVNNDKIGTKPSAEEFEYTVKKGETAKIKAEITLASGEVKTSSVIEQSYYSLSLWGKFDPEEATQEPITVDAGSSVLVFLKDSYAGDGTYSFYNGADEKVSSMPYSAQDMSYLASNLQSNDKFYVTTDNGCRSNDIIINVKALPVVKLIWPTIIIPYSGSTTNNKFIPIYDDGVTVYDVPAEEIEFVKIFDRTGNMVAEVKGEYWGGTSADGKIVMPDVYFYAAKLVGNDNIYKGTIEVFKDKVK